MKKFMLIALVAIGFIVVATPESNAGVSIGIGFGFTVFYGYTAYTTPVTFRTVTTLTARRLSITVAVTGLIIGGTAAGYTIGTTTTGAKFLTTRGRGSIPSPPQDHPKATLLSSLEKRRVIIIIVARQKIEI